MENIMETKSNVILVDISKIREISIIKAEILGYPINLSLPLLDSVKQVRSISDIVDRLLAMHCVAATVYGFDGKLALKWYKKESVNNMLTSSENRFLSTMAGDKQQFMLQIEGLWALAWALGIIDALDFSLPCSSTFVTLLPDLKKNETSKILRNRVKLRSVDEILKSLDLAYCCHWGVIEANLRGETVGKVAPYVIIERCHALEWIVYNEDWEKIELNT